MTIIRVSCHVEGPDVRVRSGRPFPGLVGTTRMTSSPSIALEGGHYARKHRVVIPGPLNLFYATTPHIFALVRMINKPPQLGLDRFDVRWIACTPVARFNKRRSPVGKVAD